MPKVLETERQSREDLAPPISHLEKVHKAQKMHIMIMLFYMVVQAMKKQKQGTKLETGW